MFAKKTRIYGIAMQGSPFSPAVLNSVEEPQRVHKAGAALLALPTGQALKGGATIYVAL